MAITVPLDPEAWVKLGRTIRQHREEAGLSRRALAEKAGVSEKSIQVAEEGRVPRGRMPQSLSRIEEALGWAPGSSIAILKGQTWARFSIREESVRLETEDVRSAAESVHEPLSLFHDHGPKQASMFKDFASRDVELTQSGHLAQDIFMRQARRYRKLRGVSTEELARKAAAAGSSLTEQDIERLEDGTRLLRMAEAREIAGALETSVDWILGSGFSDDAPEEMRWPPTAEEMEAEAKALQRRMGDMGERVTAAQYQFQAAKQREVAARQEAEMAMAMLESTVAQEREMERHYQYLLGRIDSLRAAAGKDTVIEFHPVREGEEE
ncbi:helix-turn-helix domain-containing protein [Streptomyces paradoxus]|uniref:helix-turn-helix domain-containing protein n=1 Tax=Streptomyces paradoxus TaxID=66375 RepID=UPI0037F5AFB0